MMSIMWSGTVTAMPVGLERPAPPDRTICDLGLGVERVVRADLAPMRSFSGVTMPAAVRVVLGVGRSDEKTSRAAGSGSRESARHALRGR